MNDNEKYIEDFIADIPFDSADDKHRNELKDQLLLEDHPANRLQPTAKPVRSWRTIMKSKTSKLAAAAVIIIAVLIGTQYFGTSLAWADVVEQMNKYTRYKCRQRVVRENGPQRPTMDVYHLNLSQRRQEVEDGTLHIIDMRSADPITVELDPANKKATVTKLIGFGPKKDPHIIAMVKRFEQESTERLGTKKVDGKTLIGFRHAPNEHNDFTVWVDPKTKLPVEIELIHTNRGQTIFLDRFEFDFDLPPSAFSTDVPDGYEVKTITQDYSPVENKQITAQDIRTGLNHTAYTIEKLPWINNIVLIQTTYPLSRQGKVYLIGIQTDDDNTIIIDQSSVNHDYKEAIMNWMLKEELTLETPSQIKLYPHPNGTEYARIYLETFAKVKPDFFDTKNLTEERFTRMILMPNSDIMGLSANKPITNEKLTQLLESIKEIKPE